MLTLRHIHKTYYRGTVDERVALDNVSLTIGQGEFVVIIGHNGAGKSTLLRLIAGEERTDRGQIILGDKAITSRSIVERSSWISRVVQNPYQGTVGELTIGENLVLAKMVGQKRRYRFYALSYPKKQMQEDLVQLNMGLEDRLDQKVATLSGGQRQALSIVMAFQRHPQLLLLDEHCSALDPVIADKIMKLTAHFLQQNSTTAVMVTHHIPHALFYGSRLIMMHQGGFKRDWSGETKRNLKLESVLSLFHHDEDEQLLGQEV